MKTLVNNRVILAAVNARFTHSNLAILYLRQYAAGFGYSLDVREFTIQQQAEDIALNLASENPGAVAFSVYIWNSEIIQTIILHLKRLVPECRIILGGPEVSYNYDLWMKNRCIDFIVTGRGEEGFRRLLERGVSWDGPIVSVPNPHFSRIPMPYIESDFYRLINRYVYYESSRGCPFRCSYCLSSLADQSLELRDLDQVVREIEYIAQHRPHTVKFVDRSFNASKEHARAIWRFCIERFGGAGIRFHFELHPAHMDDEDFSILEKAPAGIFRFEIGLQSTNQETLVAIGRVQEWERARENISRLVAMKKFHTHVDLIAGLPFEDLASAATSFNNAYVLGPDYLQLGFLKVLPGTEIARFAPEYGIEYGVRPPYRVVKTNWLSGDEMAMLDGVARMVNVLFNGGGFPLTLGELEFLHDSPFHLYRNLYLHFFKQEELRPHKDWVRCGSLIIDFVEQKFPADAGFFTDCLRWDWCARHAPRRYPTFLRSGIARKSRKDVWLHKKNQNPSCSGFKKNQNNSFLFEPETERFREKYMNGQETAVFSG